jgi:hypothetical protein
MVIVCATFIVSAFAATNVATGEIGGAEAGGVSPGNGERGGAGDGVLSGVTSTAATSRPGSGTTTLSAGAAGAPGAAGATDDSTSGTLAVSGRMSSTSAIADPTTAPAATHARELMRSCSSGRGRLRRIRGGLPLPKQRLMAGPCNIRHRGQHAGLAVQSIEGQQLHP